MKLFESLVKLGRCIALITLLTKIAITWNGNYKPIQFIDIYEELEANVDNYMHKISHYHAYDNYNYSIIYDYDIKKYYEFEYSFNININNNLSSQPS